MGGLFITTETNPARRARIAATAADSFHAAGLGTLVTIEDPAWRLDYYPKYGRPADRIVRFDDGDFIIGVGTFVFGGVTGPAALRRFWAEPDHDAARAACLGHYCLVLRKRGDLSLLRDTHGTFEVYRDAAGAQFSTSFLALARAFPNLTVRAEECLEYIIGGVTLGTGTPVAEIDRLDIGEDVVFGPAPRLIRRKPSLVIEAVAAPIETQIASSLDALRSVLRPCLDAFGGRASLSFSGGYDSRLLLAVLRDLGVTPDLFVYGYADAPDVRLAKSVAESCGVAVRHIEKSQDDRLTPEKFPDMVARNFAINDGFSQYDMLATESENAARIERCAGNILLLNGGGGEVFRNFFKFRGGGLDILDFVRGFFSGYDPAILRDPRFGARYEDRLTGKIARLLDLPGNRLSEAAILALYPHLRCRSWFGRETSIDTHFGDRITPFLAPGIVTAALRVPLRWKHFGVFEGRMIRALDENLARAPSSHGYGFDRDPPWRARRGDLTLYAMPTRLRRHNFRIKQKLKAAPPRAGTLTPDYLATIIAPGFPITGALFRAERLHDRGQFQRLCVLEYMFETLHARC